MAEKKEKHPHPQPAASTPAVPVAPHFVPDAGAVFQQDRSGSPRGRELSEGQANFASFSQTIAHPVEAE